MNPRLLTILAGLALALIIGRKYANSGASGLDYHSSWERAVAEARDTGRPIFLNYGGSW